MNGRFAKLDWTYIVLVSLFSFCVRCENLLTTISICQINCMYSWTRNLNFMSEFRDMNRLENQALYFSYYLAIQWKRKVRNILYNHIMIGIHGRNIRNLTLRLTLKLFLVLIHETFACSKNILISIRKMFRFYYF